MTVTITYRNMQAPAWFPPNRPQQAPNGGPLVSFWWQISWVTNATSGFIVQEMYTEIHQQNCFGVGPQPTIWSRYWEAWEILGANRLSPNAFDAWNIQLAGGARAWWRKSSVAYWVQALDSRVTWTSVSAAGSHGLKATGLEPQNLGRPLCRRSVRGEWRACGPTAADNFHRDVPRNRQPQIPAMAEAAAGH